MKKKFFFLGSIFLLYFNSIVAVTYNSEPKIFIEELVGDAIKTLSDNSISSEEKNKFIEKIATENVDINALGLYLIFQSQFYPAKLLEFLGASSRI